MFDHGRKILPHRAKKNKSFTQSTQRAPAAVMFFLWTYWFLLDKVVQCRGSCKILCFFDVFSKSPHFLHTSMVSCRGGYLHRTYVRFFLFQVCEDFVDFLWSTWQNICSIFQISTISPYLMVPPRAALYAIFLWIRGLYTIRQFFLKPQPKALYAIIYRFTLDKNRILCYN